MESYREGSNPPSYDKQFVRDWLEQVRIDGRPLRLYGGRSQ